MSVQRFFLLRSTTIAAFKNVIRLSSTTTTSPTQSTKQFHEKKKEFKHYPIPPRLPYIDGYIRDSRSDRRLRSIFDYQTRNGERKELRIEIADEKDIPLIVQSCTDLFMKDVGIFKHLNPTYDELAPLYFDRKARMLSTGVNFIVKDDDKVIGFTMSDIYDRKNVSEKYLQFQYSKDAKLELKDDYAEDIKNAPGDNEKARILIAFMEPARAQICKFVPSEANRFFLYEASGIHENYRNSSSLYPTMLKLMFESAKEKGAEYMITYCGAKASARQASKIANLLFKYPYDKFKQNGKVVFYDLCDGIEAMEVYGKWL